MYRAVLFDIDGTLVDSNDAHASAWVAALAEHGHDVPFDRVRPLIGMGGDKLLPALTGIDLDADRGQQIAARRRQIFLETHVPRLRATHGAAALVHYLREAGVTLGVATSAQRSEVRDLLRIAGADGLFDREASSDDADRSKPDPDIVEATLRKLGVTAADALMVGDTPYDIEAAQRAGVACVALRCGGWWRDDHFANALAIFDHPEALRLHLMTGEPAVLAEP